MSTNFNLYFGPAIFLPKMEHEEAESLIKLHKFLDLLYSNDGDFYKDYTVLIQWRKENSSDPEYRHDESDADNVCVEVTPDYTKSICENFKNTFKDILAKFPPHEIRFIYATYWT